MRKAFLFILLFIVNAIPAQQKLNWGEILYGNIQGLNKNNIKTLKLKKGSQVIRSVEVISNRSLLAKDSLTEVLYGFDTENLLVFTKSLHNDWQQSFKLSFKDNYPNQLSKTVDNNGIVVFTKFSKVSFQNFSYEEKEIYNFDIKKNDSIYVFRTKYFFNQKNPDLSYKETYNNGKIWSKNYFNQTVVTKEIFDNHFTIDSILQKDHIPTKYRYENYPDHQNIKIETDSLLTIQKKNGKIVGEKLEYASIPFREILYDENESVKQKIIYKNYKNSFNEWVNWEQRNYDGKGKFISRKFLNKATYRLKNVILVYRKNVDRFRAYNCAINDSRRRGYYSHIINIYSPSILFSLKLGKNIADYFDTSAFDDDAELIYTHLDFADNPNVVTDYAAPKDVKFEWIITSKRIRRKDSYLKRYFESLEVEAETLAGKKYKISLSEHPELLSFPIHAFLTKDY